MARFGRWVFPSSSHLGELARAIRAVVEPAALEEAPRDPADEVFPGSRLSSGARPAQLRREPAVERHLAEDRVPDDQLAAPLDDNGLGVVPHRDQRHPAERLEGRQQGPDERLLLRVGDQLHVRIPAPLEATREAVHALGGPGPVAHRDRAEAVLAELARGALEAHQRHALDGPQPPDQLVEGARAPAIPGLARPAEQLDPGQMILLGQPLSDPRGPRCRCRRASETSGADQRRRVARRHRRLPLDAPHAPLRGARLGRHRCLGHADCSHNLDLMPSHGADHPSPFPGGRRASAPPGTSLSSLLVTAQMFRKEGGQTFRNRHSPKRRRCGGRRWTSPEAWCASNRTPRRTPRAGSSR